jgi:hypothetical protein
MLLLFKTKGELDALYINLLFMVLLLYEPNLVTTTIDHPRLQLPMIRNPHSF